MVYFMDCAVRAWYVTLIADIHRSTYYIRTAWDTIEKIDCKLYCEKRDQTRSSLSCIEKSRMNALHKPMATYTTGLMLLRTILFPETAASKSNVKYKFENLDPRQKEWRAYILYMCRSNQISTSWKRITRRIMHASIFLQVMTWLE